MNSQVKDNVSKNGDYAFPNIWKFLNAISI